MNLHKVKKKKTFTINMAIQNVIRWAVRPDHVADLSAFQLETDESLF